MLDLDQSVAAPAGAPSRAAEFLRLLKECGPPVTITLNGKAEIVVEGRASFKRLIQIAEQAEEFEALREGIAEIRAGLGIPLEEFSAEIKQILSKKKMP